MITGPSIYSRIFVSFTAAIVIAMLTTWWLATYQLSSALNQRLSEQLAHATSVLAHGSFPLTPELLEQLAALQDAEFALLTETGEIGPSTISADQHGLLALLAAHSTPGQVVSDGYDVVVVPLPQGRTSRYARIVGVTSLGQVRAAAERAALWLGVMALVAVLLVAWWGHRLSRAVTVPIRRLADMAGRVAAGDREVRVVPPASREVGALTEALNGMTEALATYEVQLLEKNRLESLGELATRVTHEIRNPLTALKLQLQLLREALAGGELEATTLVMLEEIRRLELIVASTLTLARGAELSRTPTRLDEVAGSVLKLMTPQFAHRGIELETRLAAIEPTPLDADRLKQVVFNLLSNAADALPTGGRVRVATFATPGALSLTVEDSGDGLPDADQATLFAGASPSGKAMGLGIGLVICRELVELHGGRIAADASPDLGGARFTITLPDQPGT